MKKRINLNLCPRLNAWLAALGLALWLLSPATIESGRIDPPLADTIPQEGK